MKKIRLLTLPVIAFILILSSCLFQTDYAALIKENWNVTLPAEFEELYYIEPADSFLGDGIRYGVISYGNTLAIEQAFSWKEGRDTGLEETIADVLQQEGIKETFMIDFGKPYQYFQRTKEENSLYVILFREDNKVFIIEDIR